MIRNRCGLPFRLAQLTLTVIAWQQSFAQSSKLHPPALTPNHVTASVANLEQEAAWYERVLGFHRSKLQGGGKDFGMYKMTMPGNRIDLIWQEGSSRHHKTEGPLEQGWDHVVFNTPDLNAAYAYLAAQGTDVKTKRDVQQHIIELTLHDPEGNEIALVVQ